MGQFDKPEVSDEEQYRKNFTEEERKKHLSEEDAHDLANRMRAEIGVDTNDTGMIEYKKGEPYIGKFDVVSHNISRFGMEVQKYDYERALEAVEELEKLANEETTVKEIENKIARAFQKGGQILLGALLIPTNKINGSPEEMRDMFDRFKANRNELIDAKKEWKDLIKAGDKFGKKEGK